MIDEAFLLFLAEMVQEGEEFIDPLSMEEELKQYHDDAQIQEAEHE